MWQTTGSQRSAGAVPITRAQLLQMNRLPGRAPDSADEVVKCQEGPTLAHCSCTIPPLPASRSRRRARRSWRQRRGRCLCSSVLTLRSLLTLLLRRQKRLAPPGAKKRAREAREAAGTKAAAKTGGTARPKRKQKWEPDLAAAVPAELEAPKLRASTRARVEVAEQERAEKERVQQTQVRVDIFLHDSSSPDMMNPNFSV